MAKTAAPAMPTPRQIEDAWKAVKALDPAARIVSVGPDGVKFDYAADSIAQSPESPKNRRVPLSWT
ncbi:hypothetical protein AL035_02060 [Salipiger aestuarii]|uniref:Uncharacterized protein n=1 Tax=Salipiger aestuarii TaxID=568098 RepID=A0A327YU45_9RHOB|nr:hypothetical protein [Salipiger aestuarii]KAB2543272.1 hypothetical protein AL035_02060 [Salipiger aestuarii]RAK24071.1 hypothetical protein ATI53_1001178 [Salipiger aestuarii]